MSNAKYLYKLFCTVLISFLLALFSPGYFAFAIQPNLSPILNSGSHVKVSRSNTNNPLRYKLPLRIGKTTRTGPTDPRSSLISGGISAPFAGKSHGIKGVTAASGTLSPIQSLSDLNAMIPSDNIYFPEYEIIGLSYASYKLEIGNPENASSSFTVSLSNSQNSNYTGTLSGRTYVDYAFSNPSNGLISISSNSPLTAVLAISTASTVSLVEGMTNESTTFYWPIDESSLSNNETSIAIGNPTSQAASGSIESNSHSISFGPIPPKTNEILPMSGSFLSQISLVANTQVVANEISLFRGPIGSTEVSEIPGNSSPATQMYWPYYDSHDTSGNNSISILISNPLQSTQTANVTLTLGTLTWKSSPVAPGMTVSTNLLGSNNGPVTLQSSAPIIAVEHSIVGDSLSDVPGQSLSAESAFPQPNLSLSENGNSSWFYVANPSGTPATVSLYCGNSTVPIFTSALGSDSYQTYNFKPSDIGPIYMIGSAPLIASIRSVLGPNMPTVTSIGPQSGPISGGTNVTIIGQNFVSPSVVYFGSSFGLNISVLSSTEIKVTSPASSQGLTTITVQTVAGFSSIPQAFRYDIPSGVFSSGELGYDISWPQCPNNVPSVNESFTIIGADYGAPFTQNPCLLNETAFAGTNFALYAVVFWEVGDNQYGSIPKDCSGANASNSCFAYDWGYASAKADFSFALNEGVAADSWWLDIEGPAGSGNPLWSTDLNANSQAVQGAIDFFRSQAVPGIPSEFEKVGVYASPCNWPQIVGGADLGSGCTNYSGYDPNVPEWIADYNNPGAPSTYCGPNYNFTSGGIWLVQFSDGSPPEFNMTPGFDSDYAC